MAEDELERLDWRETGLGGWCWTDRAPPAPLPTRTVPSPRSRIWTRENLARCAVNPVLKPVRGRALSAADDEAAETDELWASEALGGPADPCRLIDTGGGIIARPPPGAIEAPPPRELLPKDDADDLAAGSPELLLLLRAPASAAELDGGRDPIARRDGRLARLPAPPPTSEGE